VPSGGQYLEMRGSSVRWVTANRKTAISRLGKRLLKYLLGYGGDDVVLVVWVCQASSTCARVVHCGLKEA